MELEHPYCKFVSKLESTNVHKTYHDEIYGFPISSDNELFGTLILEINQAGLSWDIIMKKSDNFRDAYSNFDINTVAKYEEKDIERLMNNRGIVRNKLKIKAAIYNAQKIIELQKKYGSFKNWLLKNHPLLREEWVKLFKQTFKFTGGEITNEFLMSVSFLKGAHDENCSIYNKIIKTNPYWLQ